MKTDTAKHVFTSVSVRHVASHSLPARYSLGADGVWHLTDWGYQYLDGLLPHAPAALAHAHHLIDTVGFAGEFALGGHLWQFEPWKPEATD